MNIKSRSSLQQKMILHETKYQGTVRCKTVIFKNQLKYIFWVFVYFYGSLFTFYYPVYYTCVSFKVYKRPFLYSEKCQKYHQCYMTRSAHEPYPHPLISYPSLQYIHSPLFLLRVKVYPPFMFLM